MRNGFKYRVLPMILVFAMCLSVMAVPAQAASSIGDSISQGRNDFIEIFGSENVAVEHFETVRRFITDDMDGKGSSPYTSGVSRLERWGNSANLYDVGSVDNLYLFASAINAHNDLGIVATVTSTGSGPDDIYYIRYLSIVPYSGGGTEDRLAFNGFRIYSACDENGLILCASVADAGDVKGQWVTYRDTLTQDIISYDALEELKLTQQASGIKCSITKSKHGWILTDPGEYSWSEEMVYVNPWGAMYVAPADDRVVTNDRIHIDGDGNEINVGIDLEGGTINLPDGAELDISQTIYDESTHTYHVDARDESSVTYNFSWTFHINYTSITYIGQTEEYNKYYEVYYELPDGRSSADLTAEELEQLNVSIDVLPYVRSADDTSIRALYHFDGDTEDSSYWSHKGKFTWNNGASITYMDAGVFEGALYLDERAHDFTVELPSSLGSGDFTIQFRYYQSATLAPADDSVVYVGGHGLFGLSGQEFFLGSSRYSYPVGNWCEICVQRENGSVTLFLNGIALLTFSWPTVLNNTVRFNFGSSQQTYKYLDELRVINKAIYPRDGYTPTSVPHDTNLALVLPDSKLPVADEYWTFNTDGNVLPIYDYTDIGSLTGIQQYLSPNINLHSVDPVFSNYQGNWISHTGYYASMAAQNGYLSFVNSGSAYSLNYGSGSYYYNYFPGNAARNAFVMPIGRVNSVGASLTGYYESVTPSTVCSFSVVEADGTHTSVSFTMDADLTSDRITESVWEKEKVVADLSNGGKLVVAPAVHTEYYSGRLNLLYYAVIIPPANGSVDVVYVESKVGEPNEGHEFLSSVVVMDKDDLNTPSLAVKTDIEITSHQIGGMRPSVPEKGMVWALVEGGVIKSLQIYNGSAWEAVDGRIWTGERWVPYNAYNVLLLKDLYDITGTVAPEDYEYIYTEQGFWAWLQRWLNDFKTALFTKLDSIGSGSKEDPVSDCEHAYAIDFHSEPTCTDPGKTKYSCPMCGHSYTEYEDALEHDWVEKEYVDDSYHLPAGVICPGCSGTNFLPTLSGDTYTYTCSDCQTVWEVDAVADPGYTRYECSRCGEERIEHNDSDTNLFEAIGNFLSDGVYWISDKLTQLVNSLSGIIRIFTNMVDAILQHAGEYPALFGEFLALMPSDFMNVVWFGLVLMVVLFVWKKWFS